MIVLGGIELSNNMLLSGITQASQVSYEQKRTVEGVSHVRVSQKVGGRPLTLGSDTSGGSNMGIWCQSVVDYMKLLELTLIPQTLNYRGTTYNVYIVDTSDFTPLFKWELEGPNKKYTGTIKMIEA